MIPRPFLSCPMALLALAALASASLASDTRPRRSAPADPSTACGRFGPDYKPLPGTEACVRLSGSVRAEMDLTTGSGVGAFLAKPRR